MFWLQLCGPEPRQNLLSLTELEASNQLMNEGIRIQKTKSNSHQRQQNSLDTFILLQFKIITKLLTHQYLSNFFRTASYHEKLKTQNILICFRCSDCERSGFSIPVAREAPGCTKWSSVIYTWRGHEIHCSMQITSCSRINIYIFFHSESKEKSEYYQKVFRKCENISIQYVPT